LERGAPQLTKRSGERRELPQRSPGRSPGRQRILGIFQGLRGLLETTHYRVYGIVKSKTRSSATAEKQGVSCPHGGG